VASPGASDPPAGALADLAVRLSLLWRAIPIVHVPLPAGFIPGVPVPPGWGQSS
jgi:hypothetical protein